MKRTPLKKVSKMRAEEMKVYKALRESYLKQYPTCEMCGKKPATDIHHRAGRYGGNYLNVHTYAGLCRQCHQWCHDNPKQATQDGWIIR
jgi:hypothetical protein